MTEQDYRVEELGLPRESILEEAQRIIHGERNKSYGHPRENFKNIARLWEGYLHRYGVLLEPQDVANLMILVKVARINNGVYHRDSVTDIAGYAGTIERLQEPNPDDAMLLADWEKELLAAAEGDKSLYPQEYTDPCLTTPRPRQFRYLSDEIPSDVKLVRDTEGWIWRRRFNKREDTWDCDNQDKHITDVWSGFFTEVVVGG